RAWRLISGKLNLPNAPECLQSLQGLLIALSLVFSNLGCILKLKLSIVGGAQLARLAEDLNSALLLLGQVALCVELCSKVFKALRLLSGNAFQRPMLELVEDPCRFGCVAV